MRKVTAFLQNDPFLFAFSANMADEYFDAVMATPAIDPIFFTNEEETDMVGRISILISHFMH